MMILKRNTSAAYIMEEYFANTLMDITSGNHGLFKKLPDIISEYVV